MARTNHEINIFSLSAVDLFANLGSVFLILMIVIIPNIIKEHKEQKEPRELAEINEEKSKLKVELEKLIKESQLEKQQFENEINFLKEQVKEYEIIKKENLRERVEQLQSELQKSQAELKKLRSLSNINERVIELNKENQELKKEKEKLAAEITKLKSDLSFQAKEVSFLAVVIRWATEKHDIDLIVKDPRGKIFNFQRRSYPGYPGKLVLDSRFGPGIEVWQSEDIIPGIYTITYDFYNPYGNPAPASIEGTIFTKYGAIDLPKISLDSHKMRKSSFKLDVSKEKQALVLSN